MNLTQLSDQVLLDETKRLAKEEREILVQVLHHLREIYERRLFSALKYKSIFDYAVGELKYSEGQAARRVQAMRALAAVPEIETKIVNGELSLSNVAMVQTAFVKSGKTLNRRELLKRVENKTAREAQVEIGYKPKRELTVEMIDDDSLREKAKGGSDDPQNLRLLCRSCNQRSAIIHFGRGRLRTYLQV